MRTLLKSACLAALSLAIVLPVLADDAANTWTIDAAHTQAGFAVRHMMVSTVRGHFGKTSGTITYDGKDVSKLAVDVTIDATTIDTGIADRDNHLRSADFFDVANHPTITFKSKKCEAGAAGIGAGGKAKLTGDLTMHGVTKEVVLEVEGPTIVGKDMMGMTRAGASATTKILRSDYGLKWNKAIEAGGVAVGDEVTITIDVEATKGKGK